MLEGLGEGEGEGEGEGVAIYFITRFTFERLACLELRSLRLYTVDTTSREYASWQVVPGEPNLPNQGLLFWDFMMLGQDGSLPDDHFAGTHFPGSHQSCYAPYPPLANSTPQDNGNTSLSQDAFSVMEVYQHCPFNSGISNSNSTSFTARAGGPYANHGTSHHLNTPVSVLFPHSSTSLVPY
ncbi:hypothetical protein J1614_004206 [Plenodomus biglobosus]|nr:hypothetical protein J1614_004206 [Plenodomus biglobosus]